MSEHSKPVRLAAEALHHAIAQDWPRATQAIARLNEECPGPGLYTALMGWCDTLADHITDGRTEATKVKLAAWDVESGSINVDLPERFVWAYALIAARIGLDQDVFNAQVQKLNDIDDGFERGNHVSALLETISLTIRSLPRGYALMGGES